MENKPLLEKTIKILAVEQITCKNGAIKFKIKADKESFGLFKTKQDGSESKAFQALKLFGLEATGKTIDIKYSEKPDTITDKQTGQQKNIIYKTIVMLRESDLKPATETKSQVGVKAITPPQTNATGQASGVETPNSAISRPQYPETPKTPYNSNQEIHDQVRDADQPLPF